MKVTAENIEALIVDYIDSALSKEIAAEVDRFVELNPEYAQMLSDYAEMCGVSVDVSKNEALESGVKNNLKHTSDFDDLSVPYFNRLAVLVTENIAQPHESAEFENMLLESDDNIRSAALFSKCKIQDNNDIHYPFKAQLKRNAKVRSLWYYAASVAAILFALLAIKPLINNEILINTMAMSGRVEVDNRLVADINIDVLIPVSSHIVAQPSNSPIELQPVATIDEPIVFDSLDIARSKIDYAELTVDADSMSFVTVDYAQIDDDEFEIDADNNTFIGERGVSEIRRLSGLFHRRNKERNNPKICFSYDDEGKKDGMSLLIGGREVRVWSR
ncbi:MAG: hypothetical protein II165_04980 [Bacteroidales bacterium]|nr:hypothetical protein [Bacteroidales bacterium]